jgi:Adenylate and Guanylate cyclase catalytic domain
MKIPVGTNTRTGPSRAKSNCGKFHRRFGPRPLDGVCHVLGDFVATDSGIRALRRGAGGGFKRRDEQAAAGRFAEVACDCDRTWRGIVVVLVRSRRAGAIDFSQRRGLHHSDGVRAGAPMVLIFDGYMVAGGLIEQNADHLAAMATMALAMHENVRKLNSHFGDLSLRIGLQVGSVIAGVIGIRKFIYDCLG